MKRLNYQRMKFLLTSSLFCIMLVSSVPPVMASDENVLNDDCSINREVFDREWKKYSDLDERIPLQERSPEAQRYYGALEKIVDAKLKIFLLKRDMEIDRLARLVIRDIKGRLVKNIKVNLLKAFIRLSYITYDTINSGVDVGKSYTKLLSSASAIPKVGAALKVAKGLKPKVITNTTDIQTKVKNVGLTGALEMIESVGDPKSVGKAVFDQTVKEVLPSPDLTPEEIDILRKQNKRNHDIEDALQESYKLNSQRRRKIERLEIQIKGFEQELLVAEAAEKTRVEQSLVAACQEKKKKEQATPIDWEAAYEVHVFMDSEVQFQKRDGTTYWEPSEARWQWVSRGTFDLAQKDASGQTIHTYKGSYASNTGRVDMEVRVKGNGEGITYLMVYRVDQELERRFTSDLWIPRTGVADNLWHYETSAPKGTPPTLGKFELLKSPVGDTGLKMVNTRWTPSSSLRVNIINVGPVKAP